MTADPSPQCRADDADRRPGSAPPTASPTAPPAWEPVVGGIDFFGALPATRRTADYDTSTDDRVGRLDTLQDVEGVIAGSISPQCGPHEVGEAAPPALYGCVAPSPPSPPPAGQQAPQPPQRSTAPPETEWELRRGVHLPGDQPALQSLQHSAPPAVVPEAPVQDVMALRVQQQQLQQQLRLLQQQEMDIMARHGQDPGPAVPDAPQVPMSETPPLQYAATDGAISDGYSAPCEGGPPMHYGGMYDPEPHWADQGTGNRLERLRGQVAAMARDHHGCRYLQRIVEDQDEAEINGVFEELYDHASSLMVDPVGHFLVLKLCEHCSDAQRDCLVHKIAPELPHIAFTTHGARAIQRLLDHLKTQAEIDCMIQQLSFQVVELVNDVNGNHVIQKCLQRFDDEHRQFIYDSLAPSILRVATHRHGCCILQRCIDFGNDEQKTLLVNQVADNAVHLVQDPFGNYVVQYVLDMGQDDVNERLTSRLFGTIALLSTNKFSSNVIEKCLRLVNEEVRGKMIDELTEPTDLPTLLRDQFANYVVQTALSTATPQQFNLLTRAIRPLLHTVRNTSHGKKIENRINRGHSGHHNQRGPRPQRPRSKGGWDYSEPPAWQQHPSGYGRDGGHGYTRDSDGYNRDHGNYRDSDDYRRDGGWGNHGSNYGPPPVRLNPGARSYDPCGMDGPGRVPPTAAPRRHDRSGCGQL